MSSNTFFAVFGKITLVLMVMGAVAYAAYTFGASRAPSPPASSTPTPTPTSSTPPVACTMEAKICPDGSSVGRVPPSCDFAPCPTPQTDEKTSLVAAVKAGLVAEHGADAASMAITVSTLTGDYAKGMASAGAGGGIWFAAKENGTWHLVWDGNGIIDCTSLVPYPAFPTSLIPECYNTATQKPIIR